LACQDVLKDSLKNYLVHFPMVRNYRLWNS